MLRLLACFSCQLEEHLVVVFGDVGQAVHVQRHVDAITVVLGGAVHVVVDAGCGAGGGFAEAGGRMVAVYAVDALCGGGGVRLVVYAFGNGATMGLVRVSAVG